MNDNGDNKQLVLKVELNKETKELEITRHSEHIPSLAYIIKQLDYDLTELIAKDRVKRDMKRVSLQIPGNILNRLRGNVK